MQVSGDSRYLGYFYFSNLFHTPYGEYLQKREFELSIRFGIRKQTKEIIASNAQMAEANFQGLQEV